MTKKRIKPKILLDVGCGFHKNAGYIGMDKRDVAGVDIVHDAECLPWPVEDGACSVVAMSHVIEHIKPWMQIDVINECWRVLEDGGVLAIATPYATSFGYSQDPTHCAPWNEATPTYFFLGEPLYEVYRPSPWKKERLYWDTKTSLEVVMRKLPLPAICPNPGKGVPA